MLILLLQNLLFQKFSRNTFSNVLLGLFYCRAKPGEYQVLILLLQNLLFQKFSRNTFEFPTGDICSKA